MTDVTLRLVGEDAGTEAMLKKATTGVDNLDKSAEKAKSTTQKFSASFTEINSAMQIAGQVAQKLEQAWNATAGAAVDYSLQIEKMQAVTGGGVEETNALIQVADDARIEFGSLQTAMRSMINNGTQPTIESLADMADEYVALTDPVKQAELVTKEFGTRAGPEMAKLLAQGGAALRANADEAKKFGGVTEESVKQAKEFAAAMDQLTDAGESLKIEIGNALIPAANSLLDGWNNLIGGTQLLVDAFGEWETSIAQSVIWDMSTEAQRVAQGNENIANSYTLMAKKAEEDEQAQSELLKTTVTYTESSTLQYDAINKVSQAMDAAQVASAELAKTTEANQLVAVAAAISGPLASAYDTYSSTADNINTRNAEIQARIVELRAEYALLTDDSIPRNRKEQKLAAEQAADISDEIMDLTGEYYNNKDAAQAAADAYAKQTAELIYQNSIAGLSAKQQLELGRTLGLVSESDYNLITATQTLADNFKKTGDSEEYNKKLLALQDAAKDGKLTLEEMYGILQDIDGYEADASVTVTTTNVTNSGENSTNQNTNNPKKPKPKATGGMEYVTSPTYFLAGEAGPETAIFIPQGKTAQDVGWAGGGGGMTIENLNVYAAPGMNEHMLAQEVGRELDRRSRMARNGMGYGGR